ncbi:hypothetical protein B0H14DRAFT_2597611 [Mycena olivaceomarginata]|nr:hypothetical protein B0H14DRAFT_2597611 [Mycena olivaceomarginata]
MRISESRQFGQLLTKYRRESTDKPDLYHPFLLGSGKRDENVVFCRNDPSIIRGSHGQRKPDVVTVKHADLKIGARKNVPENLSKGGPTAFHWIDLLSFWEFKVDDPADEAAAPAVPKEETESKKSRATPLVAPTDHEQGSTLGKRSRFPLVRRWEMVPRHQSSGRYWFLVAVGRTTEKRVDVLRN